MMAWRSRLGLIPICSISATGTNLADAAVAAAMRYRVGGPLIDVLMSELGMNGATMGGMLAGASGVAHPESESAPSVTADSDMTAKGANGGAQRIRAR